ncbi:MAG: hypothetical protein WC002_07860, partial [Candidatus Muiribacteriota bacterium]
DTQKLMIRPEERYNELKNKIDLIDEQIKTGLRANDTSVIRSIAEYLAYDSKGYEASHIAPVVGAARSHLSNDSVRSSIPVEAVSRLFDSYGEGLTKINDMMQADNTVSEARTHLRTRDGLSRNSEVIDNVLVPYTSIGTDDENIDEDGHIIYDIVYYASKMHKEMPRQFNERKKVHMNLMLDLLKDEMTNVNVNVDHEGESLSPGGDFLSKISGFFEIATKIIGVISNMFFNSESPLDGLSQFFTGLPALSGFVSEGQGATAGLGTAGMASAASGGTSEGSGTTASDESAAAPMDTRSGAGAQRIVRSALAAEGQGRTVHGITCYTATTEWGNKACAAVVSAILRHANTGLNRQILGVVDMEGSLPSIGFRDIRFPPASQFSPGDVVYWRRTRNDRSRHVGVIVSRDNHGTWWAIDNSSSSRRVMKRPVVRSYYPIVSGIAKYTR